MPTEQRSILTPTQCRHAREALDWSRRKLAREAMVSPATISRLEDGSALNDRILNEVKRVFVVAGIKFGPRGKIEKTTPLLPNELGSR
jgi:transcriptional regulator with XRE-family HTH domain